MEQEKKGLFGRLLDFWREKAEADTTDSIGFWNDAEDVEKHFAEMGAVASLTQEEMKKVFWAERTEESQEKQKRILEMDDAEGEQQSKKLFAEEPKMQYEERSRLSEVFAEDLPEKPMERIFQREMPEGEQERRRILSVADEAELEKELSAEEQRDSVTEIIRKEETQTEPVVDIEKLMRQMTKMLWEERESCGRRLR